LAAALAIGTYGQGAFSGQPGLPCNNAAVGKNCTSTAKAARQTCRNEVEDDYWVAIGNCNNLSDPLAQYECLDEAALQREQGRARCGAHYEARLEVCDPAEEARHDPDFDPADLVGPNDAGEPVDPTPGKTHLLLIRRW
jgi:hypothetical protein